MIGKDNCGSKGFVAGITGGTASAVIAAWVMISAHNDKPIHDQGVRAERYEADLARIFDELRYIREKLE